LRRALSYHPASLFAEKRRRNAAARDRDRSELPSIDLKDEKAQETEEDRLKKMSGNERALYLAEKFVEQTVAIAEEISSLFKELIKLNHDSLRVEADDNDRKGIQKQFLTCVKKIDDLALHREVEGKKVFSGAFVKDPIKLHLEEEVRAVGESITLRLDPLSAAHLKLDRIKIDTLINARKAVPDLERGKDIVEAVIKMLNTKINSIDYKRRQIAQEPEQDVSRQEKPRQDVFSRLKAESLEQLREVQEERAEKTGREKALLVNSVA